MAISFPKGLFNVNWARKASNIISYLKINPRPKRKPTLVKKFGYGAFSLKGDKLYVFGKEVVVSPEAKAAVLEDAELGYGGVRKTHVRIQRKYLGISNRDVAKFFAESERRQLKMPKQGRGILRAFIHAPRPGVLEVDLTMYHGAKYVVFGMVDVFSRWCHYELIARKQPRDTGAALQRGLALWRRAGNGKHKLLEVRTDSGNEFLRDSRNGPRGSPGYVIDFRTILEDIKKDAVGHFAITHRKQPMRIIENLNGILRRYVQRIDFETRAELSQIVARFVREYNESPHRTLGNKSPMQTIAIHGHQALKVESSRQFAAKLRKVGTSKFRLKVLEVGSLVRISLLVDKDKIGHHGEKPHWSKELYNVVTVIKSSRGPLRFKVKPNPKTPGVKALGPFFRDRLLSVVRPTHALNQKPKYQPGAQKAGDAKREAAALRPDLVPKIKWTDKQKYDDAQDVREDDGEAYVPDGPPVPPPKKKKRPRRAIKAKPAPKMIGRKVQVIWDGEIYKPLGYILEQWMGEWIVYFRSDGSVAAFEDTDIHRVTNDFVSMATVAKKKQAMAAHIAKVKKEIDDADRDDQKAQNPS